MRVLIVVESSFGNTRTVADAVADGMRQFATVEVRTTSDAPTEAMPTVDLLVAGGPTHASGMSRPDTRKEAAQQAGHGDPTMGVREWLAAASPGAGWVAAFDTRIDRGWIPRSAARAIGRRLCRLGGTPVADPESFLVTATPGSLMYGERDRARQWGEQLVTKLVATGVGIR